jgi:OOP family OmpA-OmpF porin
LQYAFGKERYVMPIPEPVERDSDSDSVLDKSDVCQRTPAGQSINSRGCPLDSDGDSVADDLDSCQNTPRGAIVDANGCEPDNDDDNVPNHLDQCPATSSGVRVDSKGCEIRAVIELPGVSFESNSDELLPGAESVLIDAAATLRLNSDFIVEVAGYTDSSGAAEYNLMLSKNRANTVLNYLITYGAKPASLTARGYGEAEPVADNTTAEGRVANRRVELRILNR